MFTRSKEFVAAQLLIWHHIVAARVIRYSIHGTADVVPINAETADVVPNFGTAEPIDWWRLGGLAQNSESTWNSTASQLP